jgi:hypothetical protein
MDINQVVSELKAKVDQIETAIAALLGLGGSSQPRRGRSPKSQASQPASGKRTMSPAARKRIGAAKKAWWAKQKGKSAPKKVAVPAKKAATRKPMSPAMKKKMSALMKARWAEKKKAGGKSL